MTRYFVYSIALQLGALLLIDLYQSISRGTSPFRMSVQAKQVQQRKRQPMQAIPYQNIPEQSFHYTDRVVTRSKKNPAPEKAGKDNRTRMIQSKVSQYLLDIDYPSLARKMGMQGRTIVRIHINDRGIVSKAELVKSSGYDLLDSAAMDGVSNWEFDPGPAESLLVPVVFRLK